MAAPDRRHRGAYPHLLYSSTPAILLLTPSGHTMVGILRDQHMSQQSWPCQPTIDRPRWCGCLHDAITGIATRLRKHMADDLDAGPHVLQHLSGVFAEFAEPAAAVGTSIVSG